jgi:hypothetical protein
MVASKIAAPSHPMTSTSQDMFSLSILETPGGYLKMPQLLVAGSSSNREYLRHSRKYFYAVH